MNFATYSEIMERIHQRVLVNDQISYKAGSLFYPNRAHHNAFYFNTESSSAELSTRTSLNKSQAPSIRVF